MAFCTACSCAALSAGALLPVPPALCPKAAPQQSAAPDSAATQTEPHNRSRVGKIVMTKIRSSLRRDQLVDRQAFRIILIICANHQR